MDKLIYELLEAAAMSITLFLIKKYVLLEKDLPPKKQRVFYLITAAVLITAFLISGKDFIDELCAAAVLVNIIMARPKERRGSGALLCVPFLIILYGIANGFWVPVMVVPQYLIPDYIEGYTITVYAVLFAAFAVFLIVGRKWRQRFSKSIEDRNLSAGERAVLCVGSALLIYFSIVLGQTLASEEFDTKSFVIISGMFAAAITITFVIMIMQGNKRNYYLRKYNNMQSHIITTMADIIENRDESTGGHIRRTAKYVEILSKELQKQGKYSDILTNQYVSDMVMAAPLHDIGKIHISDTVLNKPGKLTDEEFSMMKTHTTAGRELLEKAKGDLGDIRYLNIAIEMATYHHERIDGKGYPYGTAGGDIPLCAKILAVADVFDALTSKRVYKDAMPFGKACSIIREERGTHFDEDVVDAFTVSSEKILQAMNEFNTEETA